jgi:hypothetical protein
MNGNGIAAQRKAVEDYLNGSQWKLVAEFTEVESGKRSDRNVHFISGLMERKVDFVACDMPSANAFMINARVGPASL